VEEYGASSSRAVTGVGFAHLTRQVSPLKWL
jgi:hypothetical protein